MTRFVKNIWFMALVAGGLIQTLGQTPPDDDGLMAMEAAARVKLVANDVPGAVALVVAYWEKGVNPVKEKTDACQTLLGLALLCNSQDKDENAKAVALQIKIKLDLIEPLVAGQNANLHWIYTLRSSLARDFFEDSEAAAAYGETARNYQFLQNGMALDL